ncbi:FIST N-terminal domain-containing protein [uncultured Vibrio sp.]|uniref:FIST signal transduction protein n=1 Tax=uncultured Vibrio sp. TaxID=114054 RepID=UPI0025DE6BA6|nr:FIST N-terminal domain-containing protein [uncultured Vibrio sp.]
MLRDKLSSIICYYTEEYPAYELQQAFGLLLPKIPIIGCSSCKGVMTEKGVHLGPVVGLLAIYDSEDSAYGTALVETNKRQDIESATMQALTEALSKADRIGEVPGFILLHATPGIEEPLIKAIDDYFHTPVPIIGGSAADDRIEGQWSIFTEGGATTDGIALQLFYPSISVTAGLSAGYSPTEFVGTVTQSKNRELLEIDHQPAKEVYLEWISDHAGIELPNHFVFDLVTEFPIGRSVGEVYSKPYYKLSHPINITENDGLLLFTDINAGDEITLMSGAKKQLITRASRIINETKHQIQFDDDMIGAMCIICAGAMLYLKQDIHKVYKNILEELNHKPFICPFTYGEQGRFIDGKNAHGNLMISSAVFHTN